jgi:Ni,Fe-hydrogenase maturation factor
MKMGIGMVAVEPPVEIDVEIKQKNELIETLGSELSAHVNHCWEISKFTKTEITERLLKCERQRRGVYDPDKEMDIAKTGGSDIFMRLTDVKARAASNWIVDVMISGGKRAFELHPAREPELPPEVSAGIVDLVRMEMMEFVQAGGQVHPEAFRVRMEQVQDEITDKLREEAKSKAHRMENKIEDQLNAGGFNHAFREFVDDFVTYPTAILKGPVIRRRKQMKWGPGFKPVIMNDFVRKVERVSPHDIFPSPNSSTVNDGFLIERHRLTRGALQSMRGTPGYSDADIDQVLERFGDSGFRQWLMGDQERDRLEGKPHARLFTKDVIEAIEFWGSVSGSMLQQWGYKDKKLDPFREYECNIWVIGPFVIKAVLNPDPLGQRPYEIAQWVPIPGSFWGTALPEQMRDVQVMCNAAARSLANNMGVASGPQAEVHVDRLPDGEDVTSMFPWKIWQTTSDRTGGGQPAVRFFQPNMNAEALMNVFQYFSRQADEVTGIPNYVYGNTAGSGVGRTASGLSMLMDNAAKGIKAAIMSIDYVVSAMVDRLYVHNMIYDSDASCKGDFKVIARGAMGLVAKEQLQIRRNEFLQSTANPIDLQILGPAGRAYLLREVAKTLQMDTDKLVPTTEKIEFEQQKMQAMQQMQAQQAPATLDAAGNPAGGQDANLMQ